MLRLLKRVFRSQVNRPRLKASQQAFQPRLEALEDRWLLSTYTVRNTNDSGPESLRWAIAKANANPGGDIIDFRIGAGAQTISPLSALPDITDRVVIDGTTQLGFQGKPLIELNGALAGANVDGLRIRAGSSTVRGLVINRFRGDGIELVDAGGNSIAGNYIGTDLSGQFARANGGAGVFVYAVSHNLIGGVGAGARNVISGNSSAGVYILGGTVGATGNLVQGNYIGTNVAGTIALGNDIGVLLRAANNTVGGTVAGARNLISGNRSSGVHLVANLSFFLDAATGNQVLGNYIGTNAAGTAALGNDAGVSLSGAYNNTIGGTVAGARNLISGNRSSGVAISSYDAFAATGNQVLGNYIGTNAAGTAALGNATGVSLWQRTIANAIGGTAAGARNLISGNSSYGVHIGRDPASPFVVDVPRDNRVQGNHIGTDVTGTVLLSNATGVFINGGSNNLIGGMVVGARNLISGNTNSGVRILSGWATGNQVQGNYIGPDAAGTGAIGNGTGVSIEDSANNIIGEKLGTGGNVIAASEGDGVNIIGSGATGNRVIGNYLGTNAAGTAALGNAAGVLINGAPNNWIGGTPSGDRNIISGNRASGVVLMGSGATGNRVQNNLIGTQTNGSSALGNSAHGVWLTGSASNNLIGGLADGAGNTIAFNGGDGVYVESGTGNGILSNSMYSNGGLGIDLGPNGVTLNDLGDLDMGANNLQNFPDWFVVGSDINRIFGELRSTPNTMFTLQFFTNSAPDPSGYGEGQRLIQTLTVTTDASGYARFDFFYDSFAGELISATVTDAANNTSEFSGCVRAGPRI